MKKRKGREVYGSGNGGFDGYGDKDELAYKVARLVCMEGLGFASVAKQIFGRQYDDRDAQAKLIMKVKRALSHAVDRQILVINPPPHTQLRDQLKERHGNCEFEVVGEDLNAPTPKMVCLHAARTIARTIHRLIAKKKGKVVIANSGGPTLSQTVQFLQAEALLDDGWRDFETKPRFLSLNSATRATEYGSSANFLAVRMAEIYDGEHIAVFHGMPEKFERVYEEILENLDIDLVICGAGSPKGLFTRMLDELLDREFEVYERKPISHFLPPDKVAGDVAFIPIDHHGRKYDIKSERVRNLVEQHLKPRLDHGDLRDLAGRGRDQDEHKVILVLTERPKPFRVGGDLPGNPKTGEKEGNARWECSKVPVTRALLRRNLVSKCILGASLATRVLDTST